MVLLTCRDEVLKEFLFLAKERRQTICKSKLELTVVVCLLTRVGYSKHAINKPATKYDKARSDSEKGSRRGGVSFKSSL